LLRLLDEHGVELRRLVDDVTLDGRIYQAGDVVVPLAQPYRAFVKEVMERQYYPERRYVPGGEIIRPYDITSWSLPLHFGVSTDEIGVRSAALEAASAPFAPSDELAAEPAVGGWGIALDPRDNSAFGATFRALADGRDVFRADDELELGERTLPAGAIVVRRPSSEVLAAASAGRVVNLDERPDDELRRVEAPRIALIETWFHDMDAGWTRYLLEAFGVEYTLLRPGDVAVTDLASDFDVVVFPDADAHVLTDGSYEHRGEYRSNDYRPEFRKGIGDEGRQQIDRFLDAGGRVVSWGRSTALFIRSVTLGDGPDAVEVEVPVRDDTEQLEERGLYVPGSLLAVRLLDDHPLTRGMPDAAVVFSRGRPVLGTDLPLLVADRRVVAVFSERGIVASGYAEHEELLAERPAAVWVRIGRGQLVLFGFQPQFRASMPATYKLLFNALLLPEVPPGEGGIAGGVR
jgi:hypothetical protein